MRDDYAAGQLDAQVCSHPSLVFSASFICVQVVSGLEEMRGLSICGGN